MSLIDMSRFGETFRLSEQLRECIKPVQSLADSFEYANHLPRGVPDDDDPYECESADEIAEHLADAQALRQRMEATGAETVADLIDMEERRDEGERGEDQL